jgi:hypothetical protein
MLQRRISRRHPFAFTLVNAKNGSHVKWRSQEIQEHRTSTRKARKMAESDRSSAKADRELNAIGSILKALDGLDGESMQRVLDYVFSRLSISRPNSNTTSAVMSSSAAQIAGTGAVTSRQLSVKDLREEKKPDSSNQMAALVAYYIQEIAPDHERNNTISAADIEKYFKQARFNLPKKLGMALPNAAAAGYLDSVGGGMYKLNPVGYNLVAHGLPRDTSKVGIQRRRPKKKGGGR